MDAIAAVVEALTTGALQAATGSANDAISTSYRRLKELVTAKLGGDARAKMILTEHEKQPKTWSEPLRELLAGADIVNDKQIIDAATSILALQDNSSASIRMNGDSNTATSVVFNGEVAAEGSVFGTQIIRGNPKR